MHKHKKDLVHDKITDRESLVRICAGWKVKGHKIVFTNGCFDILHQGHISLLLDAAELGHKLVLGVNADASVKRLKGENRPVNNETSRSLLLAAQLYVDAVCIFEEDTPMELIRAIKPDVIVKGGDYTPETVVGADFVQSYGGEVAIVPLVAGFSTTKLIEDLK